MGEGVHVEGQDGVAISDEADGEAGDFADLLFYLRQADSLHLYLPGELPAELSDDLAQVGATVEDFGEESLELWDRPAVDNGAVARKPGSIFELNRKSWSTWKLPLEELMTDDGHVYRGFRRAAGDEVV